LSRSSAAFYDLLRRHPAATLVTVSHDSVNRVLLLQALELRLSRYWHVRQGRAASARCRLTMMRLSSAL
jgi:probable phosphoglycerate mutase